MTSTKSGDLPAFLTRVRGLVESVVLLIETDGKLLSLTGENREPYVSILDTVIEEIDAYANTIPIQATNRLDT